MALAHEARRPASMCRERGYGNRLLHNRWLKFKDGREINTWLLHRGGAAVQCLGAAAAIDPEVGILSFDDEQGVPIAILWHYTLHTNANFGPRFSADYPYRAFRGDESKRIKASQWPPDAQKVFHRELALLRKAGETSAKTIIQAWRIGEVGFASLPGELFVEWGLKIKAESPFPWTFPIELGGDYLGYLVTQQAWNAGGYESLTCRSAKPSVAGVRRMIAVALGLLRTLWREAPPTINNAALRCRPQAMDGRR